MKKNVIGLLVFLLTFFLLSNAAYSDDDDDKYRKKRLTITSAHVENNVIYIYGKNFGNNPYVKLGENELVVETSTGDSIEANLPDIEPGTYRLLVVKKIKRKKYKKFMKFLAYHRYDTMDITIGAAGPGIMSDEMIAFLCGVSFRLNISPPPELVYPLIKRVFITSTSYTGALTHYNPEGADQICMDHAAQAGLSGTFKAWISDGVDAPINTFTHSDQPYVLLTGESIASDWDDLVDGTILRPINVDENLNEWPEDTYVWTNVRPEGTVDATESFRTCDRWTSSIPYAQGGIGLVWAPVNRPWYWTKYHSVADCHESHHLYCFEQ